MNLSLQKRLAATVLRCSQKRVIFDPTGLEDIKEAITKTDIRLLIGDGTIKKKPKKGVSRVRANKRKRQKRKGLRKGAGRRKGKATARESKKEAWMKKIRAQRKFLTHLRERSLIKPDIYKGLYKKSKGGFFRSVKHITLYIGEHKLLSELKQKKAHDKIPKQEKKIVKKKQESETKK